MLLLPTNFALITLETQLDKQNAQIDKQSKSIPSYKQLDEEQQIACDEVIGKISETLTPSQFEEICTQFPKYKVEYNGLCENAIHRTIKHKNYKLTDYVACKLGKENIDVINDYEQTALFFLLHDTICFKKNTEKYAERLGILKTFLELGANVNWAFQMQLSLFECNNNYLDTPLKFAAKSGNQEEIQLLLTYGAKRIENQGFFPAEENLALAETAVKINNFKKCLFIFAFSKDNSTLGTLPKELVAEIVCKLDIARYR